MKNRPYTVLFLCPDIEVFSLLKIYKLMKKKQHLFIPIIGIFPYKHIDPNIKFDANKINRVIDFCKKNNLNYKILYDEPKKSYLPIKTLGRVDIVFFNSTLALGSMSEFFEQTKKSIRIFIPYGYFLSNSNEAIFNSYFNNFFTYQFWETQLEVELSKKYSINMGNNSYFLGYTKLDYFFDNHKQKICWKKQFKNKKKIIWAPHHSIERNNVHYGYSCFFELADVMLELAKKYENEVQFAFRPHPLLKERLKADVYWGGMKKQRNIIKAGIFYPTDN